MKRSLSYESFGPIVHGSQAAANLAPDAPFTLREATIGHDEASDGLRRLVYTRPQASDDPFGRPGACSITNNDFNTFQRGYGLGARP
jgi:hypothetical protein